MAEIVFDGVKKYMDTTLVLKDISFLITEGEKVGIVGENGCGKSTILKLIAGILTLNHCAGYPYAPVPPGYDEGWVKLSRDTTCAYLEQLFYYEDHLKVIDVLNLSFEEVHRIERELHRLEEEMQRLTGAELQKTLARYSELQQLYEVKGGYETEEKLNKICKGLKFEDSFLSREFRQLSGGEKTTVVLGKLLIDAPGVLLLDEPTNHLDMESVEWLEEYIKGYKGIVLIVSHDRYFLDHTVSKIIEVEHKVSETYPGNYSDYMRQKEEKQRIQLNAYKEQRKQINGMEQSIRELRDWAGKADNNKFFRRAASMQIKLDKLERVEKPILKENMKFNIKAGERSGKQVILASNLSKSFGDNAILQNAELLIQYGERVALIGPNGSGKTTFLRMLLGEELPDSGEISLGANINLAYLPQNLVFEDEETTVLDYYREGISIPEGKAREQLAKFLFCGGNVFKKIKLLSGGEKVRLRLSKLLSHDVNLLILDEPTNHLDTTSIESIEEALSQFKGTIMFISHDRYFINKISDRVIAIEEKTFRSYPGNYDAYKEEQEKLTVMREQRNPQPLPVKQNIEPKRKADQAAGGKKEKPVPAEKQQITAENRAASLEKEIKELEFRMDAAGPDYTELEKLYIRKEELNRALEAVLEEWVNGSDA